MEDPQILIVGGGIAGLNCALRLLEKGYRVTVAEKAKGTIDKVCGEGILPFGVELLEEMNMKGAVLEAGFAFRGLSYHMGQREISTGFAGEGFGIGIDRKALDRVFRKRCESYDRFTYLEGQRMIPGQVEGYDIILAADGIKSRWADACGLAKKYGKRLGMRVRVETTPPDKVQVHFFKNCEVYFTPTDDHTLSIALLVDMDRLDIKGRELEAWGLEHLRLNFPHLQSLSVKDITTRGPIVSGTSGEMPGIHLLGDAYRAFDPISGAGMSFALLCGKLAAEHLDDPNSYYDALIPAINSIGGFTNTILFFRGGGLRTRLMLRQLSKAPETFQRILTLHDGRHGFTDLGIRGMASFLRI